MDGLSYARRDRRWRREASPATYTAAMPDAPAYENSRLMRALRHEPVDATPVWIMRQAGRYLPEYRAVREKVTFLELCERPDLAAQVTLDAQRVLGVDAAILFADLLPILRPMGLHLTYEKGEGPKIHNPIDSPAAADAIRPLSSPEELGFTLDAVRLIRRELPPDIPLLGFAGAPFTLASYSIEGGGSKTYRLVKEFLHHYPEAWDGLMTKLADSVAAYLIAQLEAGCSAVELFDSWAGCLSPRDFRRFALPYTRRIAERVRPHGKLILFLTGNPALVPVLAEAGGDAMALDWRCDLRSTWQQLRQLDLGDWAVQGNLDPLVLHGPWEGVEREAGAILDMVDGQPGHVFNLGHGVLPETPAEHVKRLVEFVHERTSQ